jgi:hypothetical protein
MTQEVDPQGATQEAEVTDAPTDAPAKEAAPAAAPEVTQEAAPEPAKAKPWFQTRIDELTRLRHEEKRRADALEAQLRQATPEQTPAQAAVPTPDALAQAVQTEAQRLVAEQTFNQQCNEVYSKGVAEFPDFQQSVQAFQNLGGMPPAFVEAALETGAAEKVIHALGKNLDEASRILALPPAKMAVALTRFADKLVAPPKPSAAPPPPKNPLSGTSNASPESDPDKLPMDQWMAWREKQIAQRNGVRM